MDLIKFLIQLVLFILFGIVTYAFTKWRRLATNEIRIEETGKSALLSILSLLFGLGLIILVFAALGNARGREIEDTVERYSLSSVFSQSIDALIMISPAILVLRSRKETRASVGVPRRYLWESVLLGLILGGVVTGTSMIEFSSGSSTPLQVTLSTTLWGLLYFAVVGFTEEFAFRGYLQTRLAALMGTTWGWLLASVLMASVHIFQRILIMGLPSGEALLDSLSLIPFSLLMGYIMLRTEDIAAPGILHTIANRIGIFY